MEVLQVPAEEVALNVQHERAEPSEPASAVQVPDIALLYHTLVLPVLEENLAEFTALAPHNVRSAARADHKNASVTDSSATVWSHQFRTSRQDVVKGETFAKDQTDPCAGDQATTFPNEVAETGVRRTFWQARRRAKREEPRGLQN